MTAQVPYLHDTINYGDKARKLDHLFAEYTYWDNIAAYHNYYAGSGFAAQAIENMETACSQYDREREMARLEKEYQETIDGFLAGTGRM